MYVPQPVTQPVHQQPTVYAAPPGQVYVASAPPVFTAAAPSPTVVYMQQPQRQMIGYFPSGQPRYAGQ